jgi:hypothetical protein
VEQYLPYHPSRTTAGQGATRAMERLRGVGRVLGRAVGNHDQIVLSDQPQAVAPLEALDDGDLARGRRAIERGLEQRAVTLLDYEQVAVGMHHEAVEVDGLAGEALVRVRRATLKT